MLSIKVFPLAPYIHTAKLSPTLTPDVNVASPLASNAFVAIGVTVQSIVPSVLIGNNATLCDVISYPVGNNTLTLNADVAPITVPNDNVPGSVVIGEIYAPVASYEYDKSNL